MTNLRKMKLHMQSPVQMYYPEPEFFIEKIKNKESFYFIRFQIEWWLILRFGLWAMGYKDKPVPRHLFKDKQFLKRWGKEVVRAWDTKRKGKKRKYKFDPNVFADLIEISVSPKPKDFYFAYSDRAFSKHLPPKAWDHRWKWTSEFFQQLFPPGEINYCSLIFRNWAQSGKIHKIMESVKNENVLIIGPYYYKNFANKLGFKNAKYIEIHHTHATINIDKKLKEIRRKRQEWFGDEYVFGLVVGGAAGAWLIRNMYGMKNTSFIEFGRALDVYYYYDKVYKQIPQWIWGTWMENHKPKWVAEHKELIR